MATSTWEDLRLTQLICSSRRGLCRLREPARILLSGISSALASRSYLAHMSRGLPGAQEATMSARTKGHRGDTVLDEDNTKMLYICQKRGSS
jgi:hypothetical protein